MNPLNHRKILMKKFSFLLFLTFLPLTFIFSCSSGDDEDPVSSSSSEIEQSSSSSDPGSSPSSQTRIYCYRDGQDYSFCLSNYIEAESELETQCNDFGGTFSTTEPDNCDELKEREYNGEYCVIDKLGKETVNACIPIFMMSAITTKEGESVECTDVGAIQDNCPDGYGNPLYILNAD